MFPSWDSLSELEAFQSLLKTAAFWGAIVFGILAVLVGAWWAWYNNRIDDQIDALRTARDNQKQAAIEAGIAAATGPIPKNSGVLVPDNQPMPVIRQGVPDNIDSWPPDMQASIRARANEIAESDAPPTATRLYLGNAHTWTETFPLVVMGQGDEDMIVLKREGDLLKLCAAFFDSAGKLLCEIVDNQFKTNPQNTWRIENTKHRLKVFNDERKVVVDIEFINNHAIRILGDFYLRRGFHAEINANSMRLGETMHFAGGTQLQALGGSRPVAILVDEPTKGVSPSAIHVMSPGALAERVERRKTLVPGRFTIGLPKSVVPIEAGKPYALEFPISNTWDSRASIRNVTFRGVVAKKDTPFEEVREIFENAPVTHPQAVVFPAYGVVKFQAHFPNPVSAEQMSQLSSGAEVVFIFCSFDGVAREGSRHMFACYNYDTTTDRLLPMSEYIGDEPMKEKKPSS